MSEPKIIRSYRDGKAKDGWKCTDCQRCYDHHSKHRRTFARVIAHAVIQHRRLPQCRCRSMAWEWSA